MALWELFGPLMRVPSAFLNRQQRITFDQRANGAGNTHAVGLDATSTAWDGGRYQIGLAQPFTGVIPLTLDSSIDWRDRRLEIAFQTDPDRDIRPGKAADSYHAMERGECVWYTGLGGSKIISPYISLIVSAGGILQAHKTVCFASIQVKASCQLKERS